MKVSITASLGLFAATVLAHGEHGSPEVPADADWATRHMAGKSAHGLRLFRW